MRFRLQRGQGPRRNPILSSKRQLGHFARLHSSHRHSGPASQPRHATKLVLFFSLFLVLILIGNSARLRPRLPDSFLFIFHRFSVFFLFLFRRHGILLFRLILRFLLLRILLLLFCLSRRTNGFFDAIGLCFG